MARFKLMIEYEGTRYSGWQVQQNARTIMGEILKASYDVFQTNDIELYGAGRTDAGVHALGQVAHIDVQTTLAPHILTMKLNDKLPADISIISAEKVPQSFHARHSAEFRSYTYLIAQRRSAFGKTITWWIKDRLHEKSINDALQLMVGMHDFRSFTNDDPNEKSTKVLIEDIAVHREGDVIMIDIHGSHFLWNQVRRMIGVAVEVGRGTMPLSTVSSYLQTYSNEPAQFTAPPSGLYLAKIWYPGDTDTTLPRFLNLV
jgi:tRNA pseudouridine38-40 synthase